MRSTLLVFAVLGCWLALARPAIAKPKVAIVAFEGDKKNEAREMVTDAIGDDVTVLGHKQVNRTIDDLGFDATALSDKDLRKLGKELEADAIIQAKFSTKGRDKVLRFKLFVHGKKAKGFKVEFGSLKSARFKSQLHDKLLEKLGFATSPDDDSAPVATTKTKTKTKPAAGDDGSTPPPSKTKKVPVGDDDDDAKLLKSKPLSKSKTKPSGDDDDDAASTKKPAGDDADPHPRVAHAGDDDDSASVSAHVDVKPAGGGSSGIHTANRDAVRFDVGPSVSQRALTYNSRTFTGAPSNYSNSVVPGARIDGEIYPFAFGNPNGIAAGIGIGGLYDQTFGLNATTSVQLGTTFPVTQRRYSIGPRFRIMFGHTETSPSLVIGVGYGHREFEINRSALDMGNTLDLPDVDYRGYDPTIEFRLPLSPRLALSFGAGAIFVTGAGPIQTQAEYGQATITAGEGDLGFEILITPRTGVRLSFDAAQIGYKFKGNGQMSNGRDGDTSSQDVFGAADRYFGGAAMLAVFY